MRIDDEIKKYKEAINETVKHGEAIGMAIEMAVSDVITDIEFNLGTSGIGGIDRLYFWSERHNDKAVMRESHNINDMTPFQTIVHDVFPELGWHAGCPDGLYLDRKEAREVRERLEKIK